MIGFKGKLQLDQESAAKLKKIFDELNPVFTVSALDEKGNVLCHGSGTFEGIGCDGKPIINIAGYE